MEKKVKKIPERQCLGCNGHFPKLTLLRVVRAPDGTVSLDFGGKKSGRGAYICKKTQCLKKAEKNGRLAKSLACEIPAEVYARMHEELATHEGE